MADQDPIAGTTKENRIEFWQKEISAAKRRQKKFNEQAERISRIYEADSEGAESFNILYSNTETLLPNLFSRAPRPVVSRRFKDDDPLVAIAGKVLERVLAYHVDTPDPEYFTFVDLMESAVLGACVPGFGLSRIRYDVIFEGPPLSEAEKKKRAAIEKSGTDDSSEFATNPQNMGNPLATQADPGDQISYETVCGEPVEYDQILFGPGKYWNRLPWVGYRHEMTKADILASWGPRGRLFAGKLEYLTPEGKKGSDDECEKGMATVEVYEIWSRSTKEVIFVAPTYKEEVLTTIEDPLNLQGFFPSPPPLMLFSRVRGFLPKPLYLFYETQAKELNRISARINKLVEALKVRGFYGGGLKGLDELLTKPDNTLLPASTQGVDPDGPNPANSIWLVPIEKLITVLQQLYVQREQIKRVIYELTGISDIIRGSTVASETATAQDLKSQWGTLRLKKMQSRVQFYVRNYLRLVAEVVAKRYGEQTMGQVTGLKLPTKEEKAQAMQVLQQMQQQAPPPGGQPQQPDEALMQKAQMPSWDEILAVLRNDLLRNYKIDVETNSTVEPDAVEDQKQVAELIGGLGQMFQSVIPAAQQGGLPMAAIKAMLLAVARRFRFGEEIEDILRKIPDQAPPGNDGGKAAETKAKIELTQVETKNKMLLMDKQLQVEQKKLQLEERKLALEEREIQQKEELNNVKFHGQMQAAQAKAAQAAAASMMPPAQPAQPTGAPQHAPVRI